MDIDFDRVERQPGKHNHRWVRIVVAFLLLMILEALEGSTDVSGAPSQSDALVMYGQMIAGTWLWFELVVGGIALYRWLKQKATSKGNEEPI